MEEISFHYSPRIHGHAESISTESSVAQVLKRFKPGTTPHVSDKESLKEISVRECESPLPFKTIEEKKGETDSLKDIAKSIQSIREWTLSRDSTDVKQQIHALKSSLDGTRNELTRCIEGQYKQTSLLEDLDIKLSNVRSRSLETRSESLTKADLKEFLCDVSKVQPTIKSEGLDRPTKNMIMSLTEKMIQLTKMSEHAQQSQSGKLLAIEDKLARLSKMLHSDESSHSTSGNIEMIGWKGLLDSIKEELPQKADLNGWMREIHERLDHHQPSVVGESTPFALESLMIKEQTKVREELAHLKGLLSLKPVVSTVKPGDSFDMGSLQRALMGCIPSNLESRLASIESKLNAPSKESQGDILKALHTMNDNLARLSIKSDSTEMNAVYSHVKSSKLIEIEQLERRKGLLQESVDKLECQRERVLQRLMVESLSGDSKTQSRRVSETLKFK